MSAGMLFKRMAVSLVLACAGAVSAQGQIMYAGPGTIVQQQFWNPQVYGHNVYPYIAPGPYSYSFVVRPGGAILTPRGPVPYPPGPLPRPFAYGYPPNLYRPGIPNSYGPPPGHYRGYQPGPNRPRFVNPYDPPVPQPQDAGVRDHATAPQEQSGTAGPAKQDRRADAADRVNRRASDKTGGLQPQGYVMPAGGPQDRPVPQGDRPAAGPELENTAAPADPNEPAN
jgi:hypothetical protein